MPRPRAKPRCLFCEKAVRRGEAFTTVMLYLGDTPRDRALAQLASGVDGCAMAPVHYACQLGAIAGEVTEAVLDGMRDGESPVKLTDPEGDDDGSLGERLYALAEHFLAQLSEE